MFRVSGDKIGIGGPCNIIEFAVAFVRHLNFARNADSIYANLIKDSKKALQGLLMYPTSEFVPPQNLFIFGNNSRIKTNFKWIFRLIIYAL